MSANIRGAIFFMVLIVASSSICTQFVADRLSYSQALGKPLLGQIYPPFDWMTWLFRFYDYAPTTFNYAGSSFLASVIAFLIIIRLFIGFKSRTARGHEGTHGTAHFATVEEVKATDMLNQGVGVYCGGFDDESGRTLYLRHNGPEHVCAIAPTRSGKGVGLVIPTLLSWPESVFVLDIKGENYAITGGWRQQSANNIVLKFDPAEKGSGCSWNPLCEIRFGTHYEIRDAQNIALMVIDSDGKGLYDHWRKAAYELLGGVIMHALYKSAAVGRKPGLSDCADMLNSKGPFAAPRPTGFDDGDPRALDTLFAEMENFTFDADDPVQRRAALYIQGKGISMAGKPEKEIDSIVSTASTELALYTDPIIGENTTRSDFTVSDLMDHDKPVSLYFIVDPGNLLRLKPLMRLLLTRIISGLTGQMTFDEGRSKTNHKHRLLLMLDEFPSLGRLDVFESALAFIAGYGIKAYIITQDVQQLYKAYTNYESILSNCHIQIAYAPLKQETAEWLSKMAGQTTVITEQISTSGKRFNAVFTNASRSFHATQRPLMTPDEIRRLPKARKDKDGNIIEPGKMLIFISGEPVILGRQILYFLDPTFNKRSKIAPPKVSDVVRKEETRAEKEYAA